MSWIAGGVDTLDTTTITTANTLIPINTSAAGAVGNGSTKYFISGQVSFANSVVGTSTNFWTIARSSAYPPTASNSTNLASSGGLISANNLNLSGYRLASLLTPSGYTATIALSIVDTPPSGTFYYSIWAYTNLTNSTTSENVVLSVLQVSP